MTKAGPFCTFPDLLRALELDAKLAGELREKVEIEDKTPQLTPEQIIERQRAAREKAFAISTGQATGGAIEE